MHNLGSWLKGLTRKTHSWGIVTKTNGQQVVLRDPGKPAYDQTPGGLYWTIRHSGGLLYILEAGQLAEYKEETPLPNLNGGKAETLSDGAY